MRKFFNSERGAAAAEYALVLAMIGASLAISVASLGNAIGDARGRDTTAVEAAGDGLAGDNAAAPGSD